ncbi:farnesol dehydrogenase-like [Diabrotica virgifera virgifera]|uniref:Farnesol dehydrogenase-like n=1 Tax=Diabrotica virgifera virgifera TaxID=50390 RepID=A0ABM5L8S6_DIAVI|nr:farnesol dehydrogenase-like [Diabrotica virgifera virgifera]
MPLSMERWVGKVAIVTGASVGIGAAVAERLVKEGCKVIGIARRVKLMEALAAKLKNEKGKLYPKKCDVMKEEEVLAVFKWCRENLGPVHILINNAGIIEATNLINGDSQKWRDIIDTNIMGLCVGTREAVKDMVRNNVNGHIIHMNSVGGHKVPYFTFSNVYPGTKHAVTALAETLVRELAANNLDIKVTNLSPGLVKTDIGRNCPAFNEMIARVPTLESEDVADTVVFILSTGPKVQIQEVIIKPLREAF